MERAVSDRKYSTPHAIARAMFDMHRVRIACTWDHCEERASHVGSCGALCRVHYDLEKILDRPTR